MVYIVRNRLALLTQLRSHPNTTPCSSSSITVQCTQTEPAIDKFMTVLRIALFLQYREYPTELIYRGPGFLAVEWFGSTPTPLSPCHVSKLDRRHTRLLRKRLNLLTGGQRGWAWGRIIRPLESLVLYKSFNPLCSAPRHCFSLRT